MLNQLWKIIKTKETLIDEAMSDCLEMLQKDKGMFLIVLRVLKGEIDTKVLSKISSMDKEINRDQQEVRKKVFEHLAISRGKDLFMGLQLTSIVIDLERIGDYTKNMAELVDWFTAKLDFGDYDDVFNQLKESTLELFDLTYDALKNHDENKATMVIKKYDKVSKLCDGTMKMVIQDRSLGDCVEKKYIGLVLSFRYMKRANAHLKNISTAIVNPFHKIGFRPEGT